MGGQSGGVDAGHSQVGKAHVVQHLGCVGVQDDEDEQHHGQRQDKAEEIAQNRGQGTDGQQRRHGEHQTHKAAQLHGDKAILHIALQREHHDVAQEDQPAVLHAGQVDDGICNQDPDQQHQAEVKQKALGYGLVHRGYPLFLVCIDKCFFSNMLIFWQVTLAFNKTSIQYFP